MLLSLVIQDFFSYSEFFECNIKKEVKFYKIDLVIVGPEEPLVKGLIDFLIKNKIKAFGPNKFAAKFGSLNTEQANTAKSQKINKEILANATNN